MTTMTQIAGVSHQFGNARQSQIYTEGLNRQRPLIPISPELLEQEAKERMSPEAWGYLSGMTETMQKNADAFPFPLGDGLVNYLTDPAFRRSLKQLPEQDRPAAIRRYMEIFGNPSLTWKEPA